MFILMISSVLSAIVLDLNANPTVTSDTTFYGTPKGYYEGYFDGVDDLINFDTFTIPTKLKVETKINYNVLPVSIDYDGLITFGDGGLQIYNNGLGTFLTLHRPGVVQIYFGSLPLVANTDYNITLIIDDTTALMSDSVVHIYVNDVLLTGGTVSGSGTSEFTGQYNLGSYGATDYFNGLMKDVEISNNVTGEILYENSLDQKAIEFDGTTDYLELDIPTTTIGDKEINLNFSIDVKKNWHTILTNTYGLAGNDAGIVIYSDNTGKVACSVGKGTGVFLAVSSTTLLTPGQTYTLKCVQESNVLKLYLDGVLEATDNTPVGTELVSTHNLRIGTRWTAIDNVFNGKLYNLTIRDSSGDITYQLNATPLTDWSGNGNNAEVGVSGIVSDYINDSAQAWDFISASSYSLDVANSITDTKRVDLWVNLDTTTEDIIDLSATHSIEVSGGTITATGFTSPTIYMNGVLTSTITASSFKLITVTTETGITSNLIKIGNGLNGLISQIQIYDSSDVTGLFTKVSNGAFYNSNIENVTPTIDYFKITAEDILTDNSLINFSATVENSTVSYTFNTTTGSLKTNISSNSTSLFNVTVWSNEGVGYASRLYNNTNISTDLTAELYKKNSILLKTYLENGTELKDVFAVDFITDTSTFTNSTNENGTLFLYNLTVDYYTINVYNSLYNPRTYFVNVTDGSFTELNVFFPINQTETKQLNVMTPANLPIENTLITVTKLINSSYVAVGQQFSDSAGVSYFDLDNYKTYRLQLEATGYSTKIFNINTLPSIDNYDIVLLSNNTVDFTSFNDLVSYSITPINSILNNTDFVEDFQIITSSSQSLIQYITVYFNSTKFTNTTGSPAGSTTILNLNYTNLTNFDINYIIKIQGYDAFNITKNYYVYEDLSLNSSLKSSVAELKANMEESRLLMIGVFVISVLVLLFSFLIPIDKADGTRGLNGIIILIGVAFCGFLGVFSLQISIIVGLLSFLGVFAD